MSFAWFRVAHEWGLETRWRVRAVLRRSLLWRRVGVLCCGWRHWPRLRTA